MIQPGDQFDAAAGARKMDLYVAHLFRDEAVGFWFDDGHAAGPTTNCKRPQVCPSAPARGLRIKRP